MEFKQFANTVNKNSESIRLKMENIRIIEDSYSTFVLVDFNDCIIEDAIKECIELSKLKNKSVLVKINSVNLKIEADSTVQDIKTYYKETKRVIEENYRNSIEWIRALEISKRLNRIKKEQYGI